MNKLEKIELRSSNLSKLNEIVVKAKEEKRELTENEVVEFRNLETEIRNIDNELENKNKNTQKMEKFSLIRALNSKEITDEQKELRSQLQNIGVQVKSEAIIMPFNSLRSLTPAGGENAIGNQVEPITELLTTQSLIAQLGGRVMTDLVSDITLPYLDSASLGWVSDGVQSADANMVLKAKTLKPKRLGGFIPVDKRLNIQTGGDLERVLVSSITRLLDSKMSEALFSTVVGTDKPSGLFAGTGHTFSVASSAITYSNVISLETALLNANVNRDNLVYVCTPAVAEVLKSTPKNKSGIYEPIMKDGMIGNFRCIVSNAVAAGVIGMLDATQIYSAFWGGVIIEVDPYTLGAYGQDRYLINTYCDATIGNDKCVAWGKLS